MDVVAAERLCGVIVWLAQSVLRGTEQRPTVKKGLLDYVTENIFLYEYKGMILALAGFLDKSRYPAISFFRVFYSI